MDSKNSLRTFKEDLSSMSFKLDPGYPLKSSVVIVGRAEV